MCNLQLTKNVTMEQFIGKYNTEEAQKRLAEMNEKYGRNIATNIYSVKA